jgi:hypothetical protein
MIWKKIPGYENYEISTLGEIRKILKTKKKPKIMAQYKKKGLYIVGLTRNGKKKEHRVHKIMQEVFMEEPKPGQVLHHKNGIKIDNSLTNLEYISRQELGAKTGAKSRRKPVRKIDPKTKEVVDVYKSAREAGRKNFLSRQTITDYCNKLHKKKKIAPDGYKYEWDLRMSKGVY